MKIQRSNASVAPALQHLVNNPELEAKIAADQKANATGDAAGRQAAVDPFPGATADVFAEPTELPVGPYQVRPFYDGDFENLKALQHPLGAMLVAGMGGEAPTANLEYKPQGPECWVLAWMFTRPIDEVDEVLARGRTADERKALAFAAAKKAIGNRTQLGGLVAINKAVILQLNRYWQTVLGYAAQGGEGEQSSPPLPSSGAPSTASAGS